MDKRITFFKIAKKLGWIHELKAPKRLGAWIFEEAREQGISLSRPAAERLSDVVGSDLARISLSLGQLALYAGEKEIDVNDVEDLVADTRERSVFELTDAIAQQNLSRSLEAVSGLLGQRQSSIGVVMMLARHMRQLGLCQDGLSAKLPAADLAKRVGVPPFVLNRLKKQASQYSIRAVAKSLSLLSCADRSLKGVGARSKVLGKQISEQVIIENLVQELIALSK